MNRPHGNRARLGAVLVAAVAALALLALPGLASGHRHHDQAGDAGTIGSFDPETGVLTIDLAKGGSIGALVTPRTHIRCGKDRGRHHGRRHRLRGRGHRHSARIARRGDGEGRDGNEAASEPGDSRGEHGVRPGEDPPGHDGTAPGRSEGPGQGAEHSARCTTDDLVAGATVKVAELVLIDGTAYYKLVALPKQAPEGEPEGEEGDLEPVS
jgi:hypothetical protein